MADNNTPSPIAEISHGPSKFELFLDQHQKKLIVLAILLAVGVVTYIVVDGLNRMKAQEAGSALYNAEGENELKKVIQNNTGASTPTAMFLLSREQAKVNKDDAVKTIDQIISKFPDAAIKNDALVARALYLLADGKTEEAKQQLNNIISDSDASSVHTIAQYTLAELASAEGQKVEAAELFTKASDLSNHPIAKEVFAKNASLAAVDSPIRVAPPVKVEEETTEKPEDSNTETAASPVKAETSENSEATTDNKDQ